MNWQKIGKVFEPASNYGWMHSHAANPVPFVLNEQKQIVRVFFTCRNSNNVSHIGFADVDFKNRMEVIRISEKPVVEPGSPGLFDDSGCAMGYLIEKESKFYLFFLGWNLKVTVPWLNTIGLAVSDSIDGPFIKVSQAPIMDRSSEDPFSISYPSVLFDDGKYKMWYGSNLSWGKTQDEMKHVIKYAESPDLLHWKRSNQIHISHIHQNEYALSKPWVIKKGDRYYMWYSYRASGNITTYRIGYAQSEDAKNWKRFDDEVGIDISTEGWDSQMICYPSVFSLAGKTYMLYNGNEYGKTGFGVAELNQS